jgi:hypothetical protein
MIDKLLWRALQACGSCDAAEGLKWHCRHPSCAWVRCSRDGALTDVTGLLGEEPSG